MNPTLGTPKRAFALGIVFSALILLLSAGSAEARKTTFALAKPANNATVKKKTKVTVAVANSLKKRAWGVEFWVDGDLAGTDRKAPFSSSIDTRKFENGQHVFRVRLLVKAKGKNSPNRNVCEYTRSIFVNIKNKNGTSASVNPRLPTPLKGIKGQKWTLKFNDNFNGFALDLTKWSNQRSDWITGGKPYNDREGAYYKPENSTVGGGNLVQTIREETVNDTVYGDTFDRTTGSINGNQKYSFQYGYVEARVKVPSCAGCWPVFWSLPSSNTWPPEVDIFEFLDSAGTERRPFIASHFGTRAAPQSSIYYYTTPCGTATDYTGDYHTYGYLWTPKRIQPFLDGLPGPVITGAAVPQLPMYLVMALQTVTKNDAGVKFNTPGGSQMFTDYIRVWQSNKP